MKRLKLSLLLMGLLIMTGCHSQRTSETTIRIGILQVPDDVAIARHQGYFTDLAKQQHVRIQYIPFDSGVDANKALMSGDIDCASMGDTNALVALNAGIKVKLVWINSIIGNNEGLVVKKGRGITTLADLRGKKIATPFASTSHYSLMMVLKKQHLLHQVTLIDMDTQDIVAAWQRGDIDAAYTWQPTLSQLTQTGKLLTTSATQSHQGNTTANVLLMRTAFIKSQPKLAHGILTQLDAAHQLYQHHPQQAIQAAAKQIDITPQAAKQQLGSSLLPTAATQCSTRLLNGEFRRALLRTGQFMAQQQTIRSAPTLDQLIDFIDLPAKEP
ncbi:taurine ABC transporter substrate-binding protein [Lacticaseibacillus jixiensis]|uniref:taurine ABC transporter substrate-binding protein n=1 Tax=Lacticaseibacillus jixiensis TaxID=3231926 RepID=UPI0036F23ADA